MSASGHRTLSRRPAAWGRGPSWPRGLRNFPEAEKLLSREERAGWGAATAPEGTSRNCWRRSPGRQPSRGRQLPKRSRPKPAPVLGSVRPRSRAPRRVLPARAAAAGRPGSRRGVRRSRGTGPEASERVPPDAASGSRRAAALTCPALASGARARAGGRSGGDTGSAAAAAPGLSHQQSSQRTPSLSRGRGGPEG